MKDNELIIGIIGGMGSYATVDFFGRLVRAFPAEKEWERPRILVDNYCTMPSRVRAVLYSEKRDELVGDLRQATLNLMNAGANRIVLACNTAHCFLPDIINAIPQSKECFVNIIEECGKSLRKRGVSRVSLIASEGTIETKIYQKDLEPYGVMVNTPSNAQYTLLRDFIESIKQNKISDTVIEKFQMFIDNSETDTVILGCTELPVLLTECFKNGYIPTKFIIDPLQCAIDKIVYYNRQDAYKSEK